jgi:type IV pilus assembly protein PilN
MAMNNRVLSIEIGNSFTKICEMDYKVKKPKVYKVLTVETPEGIVVDGMLQPTQEYADHLVNALGTNGIRTKKVLFTISSTRVASREVQIPNVKANKIEALVKTNASDYFPVDLTQYEIGHYLAGGLAENGKLRVMALAVPKALLNSYYQLAQMCGWEIECFDYSSNSLYQVLRDEKSEKVTMVIKIDENSTIVTVLSAGKVLLQRTVAYGVQDAIDTMIASGAYAVNDPMSAVERFQKKTCLNRVLHPGDKVWEENAGRWEDEDAGNVEVTAARQKITASLEPLIVGVSRVIDFYDSRNSENPIEKSYVTGLGGSFSGMSKLFTNCLERKVHTLSEMDDKIGMSKAIRSTRPAAYISCLGAVLAPVGLIDKSTQKSKGLTVVSGTNYTFVSVAVLVLGVILSIAMAATSVTRYLGNVAQNVYLQNRVQELQPAQAVYNDYLAAEAQYDKYTYLYAYTQTPNENLVDFINELEQILPSSFYTNSFSSDLDGISMSVTVEGKEAAARTILNIRNMKSISDVQISNITDSKNELGESAVTFSITGTYADIHAETEETEAAGDTAGTTAQ